MLDSLFFYNYFLHKVTGFLYSFMVFEEINHKLNQNDKSYNFSESEVNWHDNSFVIG